MGNSAVPFETCSTTDYKKIKFNHKWAISNFSYFLDDINKKDGLYLTSQQFSSLENDNFTFYLKLYPNGVIKKAKNHVSVYLCLENSSSKKVRVSFQLSIMNVDNAKCNTLDASKIKFDKNERSRGWYKFISKATLKANANKYLPDDKLTIYCEIEALFNPEDASSCDPKVESKIIDDLSVLLQNTKLSDVTLVTGSRELKAHKAILAARSEVFAAMFEHDTLEKKRNQVTMVDIDGETCEEMLRFIYSGKVNALEMQAAKLLPAADKYGLDQLKSICEQFLCTSLKVDTAVDTLVLADLHGSAELRAKAIEFVKNNSAQIIESPSWTKIKNHPELYFELFSNMIAESLKK